MSCLILVSEFDLVVCSTQHQVVVEDRLRDSSAVVDDVESISLRPLNIWIYK